MARTGNVLQTEVIRISTTGGVKGHLSALLGTGLYGKTIPEAAERLLSISIQQLITDGVIPRKPGGQP